MPAALARADRDLPDRLARGGPAVVAAVGIGVAALLVQLPIYDRNFVSMDEGHLALTASRLLHGDLLYRDIHTGIFPGIYVLTAGLFALFGEELLVTRVAQLAVNAASVLLLWRIGLRVVPVRWAAVPPLLFAALVWISFPVLSMFNYSALAGMLALAALLAALRLLETGLRANAVMIGLLVGACLFTKQNFGGLTAVAIAAGLLLARPHSALRGASVPQVFAPIAAAGAGFSALALGWLAASGMLSAWLDSTLLSLVGSQLADFDNPIPPIFGAHPEGDPRFVYLYIPSSLFDYLLRGDRFIGLAVDPPLVSAAIRLFYGLPLAALVAAPAWLVFRAPAAGETGAPDRRRAATVAVVVFAVVFFFGIFPSCVFSHLVYVLAPILLLYVWLGAEIEAALAARSPALARGWLALAGGSVLAIVAAAATIPGHVRASYATPSALPHVGIRVSEDQAKLNVLALRFIEECAQPGEPIFALPILPILYLASDHPNPVKWDLLIPGAIDEAAIVETLEREQVRCIVKQRDMNPEFPPLSALYPTLDGYVSRSYRPARMLAAGGQVWHGLVRSAPFRSADRAGGTAP